MELFYQTVSMKSVGKLTEFMRNHMLEKLDVKRKLMKLNTIMTISQNPMKQFKELKNNWSIIAFR